MAISREDLYRALRDARIGFLTGVPDSLLAGFCSDLGAHCGIRGHVMASNEGAAVSLADGYHRSTGRTPGASLKTRVHGVRAGARRPPHLDCRRVAAVRWPARGKARLDDRPSPE